MIQDVLKLLVLMTKGEFYPRIHVRAVSQKVRVAGCPKGSLAAELLLAVQVTVCGERRPTDPGADSD